MKTKKRNTEHSGLGASSMSRVMACPGSYHLCKGLPDEDNEYSLEGSVAHRLAEKALTDGKDISFYLGRDVLLENGFAMTVTKEMELFVGVYVRMIRDLVKEVDGSLAIEKPVHLDWLHDEFWGTVDVEVEPFCDDTLYVVDFKYGAGVNVEVKDNPQLMFYALGSLGKKPKTGDRWKFVKVGICQPRGFHSDGPVRWADPISVEDLRAWGDNVLLPAAKEALKRNAPLVTGEQCRWCKASIKCPKIENALVEVETAVQSNPIVTPEFVARMLELKPRVDQFFKKVFAVGMGMARSGEEIPGFKMVRGKADRRWKPNAQEVLELYLGEDVLWEKKLRSPAQVETIWKEVGGNKKELVDLIETPEGNLTLAPMTDKRAPVSAMSTSDIFNAETGE